MELSKEKELSHSVFPFVNVYKDGTFERLVGTEVVPAGLDPETNVLSKDVVIVPETDVITRIYRPSDSEKSREKLPLVIYYHGGGFFLSSAADPKYHKCLNRIVAEANVILVSVGYRLAPENPLPTSVEDSWNALKWISAHTNKCGHQEEWINRYADFDRVFLAGDSCGATMAHHFVLRLKESEKVQIKIRAVVMIQPYFLGKQPIGHEVSDPFRKSMVDGWWMFVCNSDKGCDDPLINPFVDGSPSLDGLACDRILVIVAGNDILRVRGRAYYEKLVSSGWHGSAEFMESEGEEHVFHILNPNCENAKIMFKRIASFINQQV